ncbi:MAG: hypothetical protein ACK4VY_02405 [Brevundimonas sp.]
MSGSPDYIFQHAVCFRSGPVLRAGAGDIALIMQSTLTVKVPGLGWVELTPGQTLYSHHVADLPGTMKLHLEEHSDVSDLRFALGLVLIGGDSKIRKLADQYPGYVEGHVDVWLNQHTAFAVGTLPKQMMIRDSIAPLNGAVAAWRAGGGYL